jgi:hypothetical protein
MLNPETHVPIDIDFSEIELDTIETAAHTCGQTVEAFMHDATRRRPKRIVFVPANAIPAFPFFKPLGAGVLL